LLHRESPLLSFVAFVHDQLGVPPLGPTALGSCT
jgi:hypothetical protein